MTNPNQRYSEKGYNPNLLPNISYNPNFSRQKAQESDDVEANEAAFRNKPFADTKSQQTKHDYVVQSRTLSSDGHRSSRDDFIAKTGDKTADTFSKDVNEGEQSPSYVYKITRNIIAYIAGLIIILIIMKGILNLLI